MPNSKTIMIVTGEASGDRYGGDLVQALHHINQEKYHFVGIGGSHMQQAGVSLLLESVRLGVVGIVEILKHYKELKTALEILKTYIKNSPPDLLILIDHPEFNLRLAKTAKQQGVKVLFYISPQVWAWRPWRVHGIGKVIDMMAVIFPFEVGFYQKANIPVRFVGHPLAESVNPTYSKPEAFTHFGLSTDRHIIGICPGSRLAEIQRLLPSFLETAKKLHNKYPDWQFVLPLASSLSEEDLAPFWEENLPIKVIHNAFYDSIQLCDAVITASGTATLEIGLLNVPMVICYRVAPLTYWIAKNLVTVKHIGLVNIVLEERVVKEFIQHEVQSDTIMEEIEQLVLDKEYQQQIKQTLEKLSTKLGTGGTSTKLAKLVEEILS